MVQNKKNNRLGFTLVEGLVGAAVFVILALSVYRAYTSTMDVVRLSRVKIAATALGNEQFEIIRNLAYSDVGIVGGLPRGKIPATQTLNRDGKDFTVITTIRNIDDPFDGTIDGTPKDTSPADYKLAEIQITCSACKNFPPLSLTTHIAPKNLESASTNGAIFIRTLNSSGEPVTGASVHIENNQTIPVFEIDDVTNNNGLLAIVDAPPGAQAYEISVSKDGYTSEKTYALGDPENPTPNKIHATVLVQQLTETSFIIDPSATLNIMSIGTSCQAIPDIGFSLKGTKQIGSSPIIYKYDATSTTDTAGEKDITNLDSDTYDFNLTDNTYILAGTIPSPTFSLNPGETKTAKLIVAPIASSSLLVTVKDLATNVYLSEADVRITTESYDSSITTASTTDCLAQGQAFFTGLNAGNYNINVSKAGYNIYTDTLNISGDWQQKEITLTPQS
jgi:type II secretory pathway pseudopilin PulG